MINDCWSVEERGRAVTLYSLVPLLGPIIGPIAGAWITVTTTWQWVVSLSIVTACVGIDFPIRLQLFSFRLQDGVN